MRKADDLTRFMKVSTKAARGNWERFGGIQPKAVYLSPYQKDGSYDLSKKSMVFLDHEFPSDVGPVAKDVAILMSRVGAVLTGAIEASLVTECWTATASSKEDCREKMAQVDETGSIEHLPDRQEAIVIYHEIREPSQKAMSIATIDPESKVLGEWETHFLSDQDISGRFNEIIVGPERVAEELVKAFGVGVGEFTTMVKQKLVWMYNADMRRMMHER